MEMFGDEKMAGIRHAMTGVIFRAENMVLLVLYVW